MDRKTHQRFRIETFSCIMRNAALPLPLGGVHTKVSTLIPSILYEKWHDKRVRTMHECGKMGGNIFFIPIHSHFQFFLFTFVTRHRFCFSLLNLIDFQIFNLDCCVLVSNSITSPLQQQKNYIKKQWIYNNDRIEIHRMMYWNCNTYIWSLESNPDATKDKFASMDQN